MVAGTNAMTVAKRRSSTTRAATGTVPVAVVPSEWTDFNDRASKLITPGVDHYQVIFTVPEIVSTLALANRSEIADLLFKSAWRAIKKTVTAEQGYDPAALMVLHTWNQKLEPHWHCLLYTSPSPRD